MASTKSALELRLPTVARRRKTYAQRTAANTKSARITAKALTEKPVFIEDADGHMIRQWKPEEMKRYTNDDMVQALRLRRAVETEDLLEFVPPNAVNYMRTKGWIVPATLGGYFLISEKAAVDLSLPRTHQGRKIQFHKA
jgi:hypothetical protein